MSGHRARVVLGLADCVLLVVFLMCLVLGMWARLDGLSAAPLAVDEYYLAQSVLNVLREGIPHYPCGGYYTRGLIHQYLTAGLSLLGVSSIELAVRLPSFAASILTLGGAFLLARYLVGWRLALLTVALLSVSLWEVEFARFGRMYALLQACTVFHAYLSVRYLDGGERRWLWAAIGLGGVAVLCHEAGLLLMGASVLLVVVGRPRYRSDAALATLVLVAGLVFQTTDFRFLGVESPYSEALLAAAEADGGGGGAIDTPHVTWPAGARAVGLLALIAGLALLLVRSRRRLWKHGSLDNDALVAVALVVFLCAMALQMTLLAALVLAVTMAFGIVRLDLLLHRRAMFILCWASLTAMLIGWIVIGAGISAGMGLGEGLRAGLRYPDLYLKIWLPWSRVLPWLGLVMALINVAATFCVRHDGIQAAEPRRWSFLFGITLSVMIAAAIAAQPYYATRYTYFLYPSFLIVSLAGARLVAQRWIRKPYASTVAFGVVGTVFLLSNDFNLRHLLQVAQPEQLFRINYPEPLQEHFYRRWDYRAVGRFVDSRASSRDLVIATAYPVTAYYVRSADAVYVDQSSKRIWAISGCTGTRDLWSNKPLLYRPQDLVASIESSTTPVWLVMNSEQYHSQAPIERELLRRYRDSEVYRSIDGNLVVLRIVN